MLGFVSAAVLAWAIGPQNPGANAFALANQLPNNIYAIIAAGLLSAVLVPQIVRAGLHADGGQAFVNRLVTLGVVVFVVATVDRDPVRAAARRPVRPGCRRGRQRLGGGRALATAFAYWCLPQIFFYALYALLGEVLNARGSSGRSPGRRSSTTSSRSSALLVFAAMFGVDPAHQARRRWTPPQIAAARRRRHARHRRAGARPAAVLAAHRPRLPAGLPLARRRARRHGRAAGWTFGMILVTQLAGIVQSKVALHRRRRRRLGRRAAHRLADLHAAALDHRGLDRDPVLHADERARARRRPRRRARRPLALAAHHRLLVVGAAAALAAAALPFAAVFSNAPRRGRRRSARVLLAFLLGLVPFSVLFVMQRTFYALGDTRTPFLFQLVQSALFVGGRPGRRRRRARRARRRRHRARHLARPAPRRRWSPPSLLRRRLGGVGGRRLVAAIRGLPARDVPAAAAGVGILWLLGGLPGDGGGFAVSGRVPGVVSVILIGAVSFGVYLGRARAGTACPRCARSADSSR